jgi:exopolysaccharide biosynthesis protein
MENNRNKRSTRRYGRSTIMEKTYGTTRRNRNSMPLAALLAMDLVGVALVMAIFCLFYFMLPRTIDATPVTLPKASSSLKAAKAPLSTIKKSDSAGQTDTTVSPGDTPATDTAGNTADTATPGTTNGDQGMWGSKFKNKFASGDPETTDTSYKSKDINVTIQKKENNGITWYVADIYVRNLESFKTALAKDKFGKGITAPTLDIANSNNAIVAISGDYYGNHETGIVIRNGQLYRKTSLEDVLVMNNDGSMQTFENKNFNVDNVIANGAWQAWSFGPRLLDENGQPMTKFNSTLNPANPRAAIGYYEPGHYCLVLVDGRQPGYSDGISLKAFSQLFADMGCKAAYNLDGGQTAVMTFMGKWVNKPYKDGRNVSDIVYIGDKTN